MQFYRGKATVPKIHHAVQDCIFMIIWLSKLLRISNQVLVENMDVNKAYLEQGKPKVGILRKGTAWIDTGTLIA
jgi:glucose-1-phosphate thymidylyltransferase